MPARRREHAGRLIAPGAVEGVFGDRHELDVGEAEIAHVGQERVGQFAIAQPILAVIAFAPPRAEMDLVDRDRPVAPRGFAAPLHPLGVAPGVRGRSLHDRRGSGAQLAREADGVGSQGKDVARRPDDLVLVVVRRSHGYAASVIEVGDLVIHTEEMTATRAGRPLALTAMEYRLLEYMAHRPRAVLSKSELLEHLYDHNWEKFSNVLEVYISSLRRKLNSERSEPLIHTLKGRGYVLTHSQP